MKTFDTDDNNILSDTEIAAVKEIDCKGRAITNLKGIEYFTALEYLYCYDNELTELDLSRNTKLKELNCSTNRLTVLDLSQNPKLKRVICSDNALTALNLSSNSKLTNLNASGNIREITLTGNTFDQMCIRDRDRRTHSLWYHAAHFLMSETVIRSRPMPRQKRRIGNTAKMLTALAKLCL